MGKDEGYWFTTETGVHIHVEPGESKKDALDRKFGGHTKSAITKGGYNEIDPTWDHIRHNPDGSEGDTVYYNGKKGSRVDMRDEYGLTIYEQARSLGYNHKEALAFRNKAYNSGDSYIEALDYDWNEYTPESFMRSNEKYLTKIVKAKRIPKPFSGDYWDKITKFYEY